MPHVLVEYSAPLEETHDIAGLFAHLFQAVKDTGVFPNPAAIKVRGVQSHHCVLGSEIQSLVHVTLRVMPGRDDETKASVTKAVLAALEEKLPDVGSLSVDIFDLEPATYAKRTI
ncbi:5-carboxymethyl-2-hydroxymuconate Delta-isomerase [Actibacterium lipolyticum]|uniref:5-carboxymethyl-2-hydroxymuconate Delta-isomerase n=1 Tax=Actibacterium lipolyticum TaxID=1524263 RepID=A0A238KR23_9RHOB|nr:5-carboxymethyl-2-hydroxymuconate Delta-isomerase [Actibacterium lipolyticum]SMX45314.1 5-carboxymethyl-2-hydroxymuconate Delta-isomerase [Actibacterium lipolyticum]